ncbi:MAG TPA: hypothetical protein VF395_08175, partial [Polyangiaceae bacterium]
MSALRSSDHGVRSRRLLAWFVILVTTLGALAVGCDSGPRGGSPLDVGTVRERVAGENGAYCAAVADCLSGTCTANVCVPSINAGAATACTNNAQCKSGFCNLGSNRCWYCGAAANNCDDGNSCTTEGCSGAYTVGANARTCTHAATANGAACGVGPPLATGMCESSACCNTTNHCAIAGACYVDGAVNPGNACQVCTVATSATAWTSKANGSACAGGLCEVGACCTAATSCAIAGACYANTTANPGNACQQ